MLEILDLDHEGDFIDRVCRSEKAELDANTHFVVNLINSIDFFIAELLQGNDPDAFMELRKMGFVQVCKALEGKPLNCGL